MVPFEFDVATLLLDVCYVPPYPPFLPSMLHLCFRLSEELEGPALMIGREFEFKSEDRVALFHPQALAFDLALFLTPYMPSIYVCIAFWDPPERFPSRFGPMRRKSTILRSDILCDETGRK